MRALASRRTLTPDGLQDAAVLIDGERIVDVVGPAAVPSGVELEDLGERVLMAGLVDCHVHINEPGRTEWEGFVTATEAAAAGGVTTLVDMPLNCTPVTTTAEALLLKLESSKDELFVDVGFWGGVVPNDVDRLPELAAAGVLGAKAFLCHSGIDDFPKSDRAVLERAMRHLREAGLPLLAHAELELAVATKETKSVPRHYDAWLSSRPASWEDAAIELLIELCRETGCAVHVVHLSSASALPMIAAAKQEGLPLTVETCPHYLCLRAEDIPDGDTTYKCAPPIRDDQNRDALWRGLLEGVIDLVVTDHSPCSPHLKQLERGDFIEAWGGIASLSLGLSSVWTEARRRGARLEDLGRWMSERPAELGGLSNQKGRLSEGMDADLVLWDPDESFVVTSELLRFRHRISPYVGRRLSGVVHGTWLRGRRIYDGRRVEGPFGTPLLHQSKGS